MEENQQIDEDNSNNKLSKQTSQKSRQSKFSNKNEENEDNQKLEKNSSKNSDNEQEPNDNKSQKEQEEQVQEQEEEEQKQEPEQYKTHRCEEHEDCEAKFVCIDNNCKISNKVACSECIADGPHKLHQNKKIVEIQKGLEQLYAQYTEMQEEKLKKQNQESGKKDIDYDQIISNMFLKLKNSFIEELQQIEENFTQQIAKQIEQGDKGKTSKSNQNSPQKDQQSDIQETPYTLINNLDNQEKSVMALKIVDQKNPKMFDPAFISNGSSSAEEQEKQKQRYLEQLKKALLPIEANFDKFLEKDLQKQFFVCPNLTQLLHQKQRNNAGSPGKSRFTEMDSVDQLADSSQIERSSNTKNTGRKQQQQSPSATTSTTNANNTLPPLFSETPFQIDEFKGIKEQQFIGHSDEIIVLLPLDDNRVLSTSKDKSIRIWDLKQNRCIQRLEGHTGYVQSVIRLTPNLIATGGGMSDKTIRIWDLEKNHCIQVLSGHESGITAMAQLDECGLASASQDKSLMFWNWKKLIVLKTLKKVHLDTVVALYLQEFNSGAQQQNKDQGENNEEDEEQDNNNNLNYNLQMQQSSLQRNLISVSMDKTIKVWSIKYGDCLKVINVQRKYQQITRIDSNHFALGCDKDLVVMNTTDWSVAACLKGHKKPIKKISVIDEDVVATGAGDKQIILWDWRQQTCLNVFEGHFEGVTAVERMGQKIVSGGEDKRIIIWK